MHISPKQCFALRWLPAVIILDISSRLSMYVMSSSSNKSSFSRALREACEYNLWRDGMVSVGTVPEWGCDATDRRHCEQVLRTLKPGTSNPRNMHNTQTQTCPSLLFITVFFFLFSSQLQHHQQTFQQKNHLFFADFFAYNVNCNYMQDAS
jgi:hypothetical protein